MKRLFTLCTVLLAAALPALAGDGNAMESANLFGGLLLAVGAYYAAGPILRITGLSLPMMGMMLASTIDVTALNTAFGVEYADQLKQTDLKNKLFEKSTFDQLFTIEYTDQTEWRKETGYTGEVTQAYQDDFTPSGTLTFHPSKYSLDAVKVDWSHNYLQLKRGANGWMTKVNEKPTMSALVRYITDMIAKQHKEDMELKAAFRGVRVAPTPGTAGPAINSMDGFKQVINLGIQANTITPIAVGAMPSDPEEVVDYVELFAKGIAHREWGTPMTLAMSVTNFMAYQEGYRKKYKTYYEDGTRKDLVYTHPFITVEGHIALGTSNKIFCSPKDNIYKVVNPGGPNDTVEFHVESEDRTVKVWTDIWLKYCIWDHQRFYTNDVETTVATS